MVGIAPATLIDLIDTLRDRDESVATAESLTAGLVCAVLTSVPGASAVVRGGLAVYASDLKSALAGVDAGLLAAHGAVHPDVAGQLARGARDTCAARWGIGLTGVAGPSPQDGVEPGTVHVAVAGPDSSGTISAEVRTVSASGDRHEIRCVAVRAAINLLVERVG